MRSDSSSAHPKRPRPPTRVALPSIGLHNRPMPPADGDFPIAPPVEPMLAKLAEALPEAGDFLFEPKWDGFRAIVFRGAPTLYIQSRDLQAARPLLPRAARGAARAAARALRGRRRDRDRDAARARLRRAAAAAPSGGLAGGEAREGDAGLVRRLRPARGRRPATCMAAPQRERRARARAAAGAASTPPLHLTPMTRDRATAARLARRSSRAPGSTA